VDVIDGHVAQGEFVELDPPRRLVHTFGWEPKDGRRILCPPGASTIEIELEPSGAGTLLKFRHYGLPGPEAARAMRMAGTTTSRAWSSPAGATTRVRTWARRACERRRPRRVARGAQAAAREGEGVHPARDELTRQRQALPWEPVENDYVFDGPNGNETLADLFDGRSQLIVYHFMFAPEDEAGCKSCSFWADNFNPNVIT
jgi:hypothetical protein